MILIAATILDTYFDRWPRKFAWEEGRVFASFAISDGAVHFNDYCYAFS